MSSKSNFRSKTMTKLVVLVFLFAVDLKSLAEAAKLKCSAVMCNAKPPYSRQIGAHFHCYEDFMKYRCVNETKCDCGRINRVKPLWDDCRGINLFAKYAGNRQL
ncbi:Uncharacterised protein r2_g1499 [Pycnogonum litorale]